MRNVHESNHNKYYKEYQGDVSEDDEDILPICLSCQKESVSLNSLRHCISYKFLSSGH